MLRNVNKILKQNTMVVKYIKVFKVGILSFSKKIIFCYLFMKVRTIK